jgi:hypothetical protein
MGAEANPQLERPAQMPVKTDGAPDEVLSREA